MKTNLEMQAQISKLNQIVENTGNLEKQLEDKQKFNLELQTQKQSIHKELDKAADHLIQQEDKIKQANQTALELLTQLKEADSEIENLKVRIRELQALSAVYQPVKGDDVDNALAAFLNNFHDKAGL